MGFYLFTESIFDLDDKSPELLFLISCCVNGVLFFIPIPFLLVFVCCPFHRKLFPSSSSLNKGDPQQHLYSLFSGDPSLSIDYNQISGYHQHYSPQHSQHTEEDYEDESDEYRHLSLDEDDNDDHSKEKVQNDEIMNDFERRFSSSSVLNKYKRRTTTKLSTTSSSTSSSLRIMSAQYNNNNRSSSFSSNHSSSEFEKKNNNNNKKKKHHEQQQQKKEHFILHQMNKLKEDGFFSVLRKQWMKTWIQKVFKMNVSLLISLFLFSICLTHQWMSTSLISTFFKENDLNLLSENRDNEILNPLLCLFSYWGSFSIGCLLCIGISLFIKPYFAIWFEMISLFCLFLVFCVFAFIGTPPKEIVWVVMLFIGSIIGPILPGVFIIPTELYTFKDSTIHLSIMMMGWAMAMDWPEYFGEYLINKELMKGNSGGFFAVSSYLVFSSIVFYTFIFFGGLVFKAAEKMAKIRKKIVDTKEIN